MNSRILIIGILICLLQGLIVAERTIYENEYETEDFAVARSVDEVQEEKIEDLKDAEEVYYVTDGYTVENATQSMTRAVRKVTTFVGMVKQKLQQLAELIIGEELRDKLLLCAMENDYPEIPDDTFKSIFNCSKHRLEAGEKLIESITKNIKKGKEIIMAVPADIAKCLNKPKKAKRNAVTNIGKYILSEREKIICLGLFGTKVTIKGGVTAASLIMDGNNLKTFVQNLKKDFRQCIGDEVLPKCYPEEDINSDLADFDLFSYDLDS